MTDEELAEWARLHGVAVSADFKEAEKMRAAERILERLGRTAVPDLIAEVRRLRNAGGCWDKLDRIGADVAAYVDAAERMKERAAIVAWLRRMDDADARCYTQDDSVCWVADAIEAGEHLK